MLQAINTVDELIDFGADICNTTIDLMATASILLDNCSGWDEAIVDFAQVTGKFFSKVFYCIKFACLFVFFAGQALGDWYRANQIDVQITEGARGFVPAVREGMQVETPKAIRWVGRAAGWLAARVADGFGWMLRTGVDILPLLKQRFAGGFLRLTT
jgi:hypothetical protein